MCLKKTEKYYNPYKLFVGSFVPNWLLCRKEISPGAKLCFARLAQFAGKDGRAYPLLETLAREVGVSRRQICTYIKQLEKFKLLNRKRNGLGKSNTYWFLEHKWFTSGCEEYCTSDVKNTAPQDVKNTAHPIYKEEENHRRESYKEKKNCVCVKEVGNKFFEKEMWAKYPKRYGSNSEQAALRCYTARINEGETKEKILTGVKNYHLYCEENCIINTQYVMTASKFLGKDKHYLEFQEQKKKRHWADDINKPPDTGLPKEDINCRCSALPVANKKLAHE